MSSYPRRRPPPILNPYDQLSAPQFDSFVSDITSVIRDALNPAKPKLQAPPAGTSSFIAPVGSPWTPTPAPQPNPPSKRAPSFEVISDDGTDEGSEGVHDRPNQYEETEDEAMLDPKYALRDPNGEEVEGSDEYDDAGLMDDTFDATNVHVPSLALPSSKGKGRAPDEGPGVEALKGISDRLQRNPHLFAKSVPESGSEGDDEEEEEEEGEGDDDAEGDADDDDVYEGEEGLRYTEAELAEDIDLELYLPQDEAGYGSDDSDDEEGANHEVVDDDDEEPVEEWRATPPSERRTRRAYEAYTHKSASEEPEEDVYEEEFGDARGASADQAIAIDSDSEPEEELMPPHRKSSSVHSVPSEDEEDEEDELDPPPAHTLKSKPTVTRALSPDEILEFSDEEKPEEPEQLREDEDGVDQLDHDSFEARLHDEPTREYGSNDGYDELDELGVIDPRLDENDDIIILSPQRIDSDAVNSSWPNLEPTAENEFSDFIHEELPADTNLATLISPSVQVAESKQELDELAASEADMMGGPPMTISYVDSVADIDEPPEVAYQYNPLAGVGNENPWLDDFSIPTAPVSEHGLALPLGFENMPTAPTLTRHPASPIQSSNIQPPLGSDENSHQTRDSETELALADMLQDPDLPPSPTALGVPFETTYFAENAETTPSIAAQPPTTPVADPLPLPPSLSPDLDSAKSIALPNPHTPPSPTTLRIPAEVGYTSRNAEVTSSNAPQQPTTPPLPFPDEPERATLPDPSLPPIPTDLQPPSDLVEVRPTPAHSASVMVEPPASPRQPVSMDDLAEADFLGGLQYPTNSENVDDVQIQEGYITTPKPTNNSLLPLLPLSPLHTDTSSEETPTVAPMIQQNEVLAPPVARHITPPADPEVRAILDEDNGVLEGNSIDEDPSAAVHLSPRATLPSPPTSRESLEAEEPLEPSEPSFSRPALSRSVSDIFDFDLGAPIDSSQHPLIIDDERFATTSDDSEVVFGQQFEVDSFKQMTSDAVGPPDSVPTPDDTKEVGNTPTEVISLNNIEIADPVDPEPLQQAEDSDGNSLDRAETNAPGEIAATNDTDRDKEEAEPSINKGEIETETDIMPPRKVSPDPLFPPTGLEPPREGDNRSASHELTVLYAKPLEVAQSPRSSAEIVTTKVPISLVASPQRRGVSPSEFIPKSIFPTLSSPRPAPFSRPPTQSPFNAGINNITSPLKTRKSASVVPSDGNANEINSEGAGEDAQRVGVRLDSTDLLNASTRQSADEPFDAKNAGDVTPRAQSLAPDVVHDTHESVPAAQLQPHTQYGSRAATPSEESISVDDILGSASVSNSEAGSSGSPAPSQRAMSRRVKALSQVVDEASPSQHTRSKTKAASDIGSPTRSDASFASPPVSDAGSESNARFIISRRLSAPQRQRARAASITSSVASSHGSPTRPSASSSKGKGKGKGKAVLRACSSVEINGEDDDVKPQTIGAKRKRGRTSSLASMDLQREIERGPSPSPPSTPVAQIPAPVVHRHQHGGVAPNPNPRLSQASSSYSSPVTRSNCRFHKVSIPTLVPDSVVYFIVPGCSLNSEIMEEEGIEDCGEATTRENETKTTDMSDVDGYILGTLRKLVGIDLLHEQACGYLSSPEVLASSRAVAYDLPASEKRHKRRQSRASIASSSRNDDESIANDSDEGSQRGPSTSLHPLSAKRRRIAPRDSSRSPRPGGNDGEAEPPSTPRPSGSSRPRRPLQSPSIASRVDLAQSPVYTLPEIPPSLEPLQPKGRGKKRPRDSISFKTPKDDDPDSDKPQPRKKIRGSSQSPGPSGAANKIINGEDVEEKEQDDEDVLPPDFNLTPPSDDEKEQVADGASAGLSATSLVPNDLPSSPAQSPSPSPSPSKKSRWTMW